MLIDYETSVGFTRYLLKDYGFIQVGKSKRSTYYSKAGNPKKIRISDHKNNQYDVVYSILLNKFNESSKILKDINKAIKLFNEGSIK